MWLLWKETELFSCPKASEENGFYHMTFLWTLNLAKESTKGQDSKPSQANSVSCMSSSIALGSFWALCVKDQGSWFKKMIDKQKCLPAFLTKCDMLRWDLRSGLLVIYYGISLARADQN